MLPQFLFINPQQGITGNGIILSTTAPYIMANVHSFYNANKTAAFMVKFQDFAVKKIPNYYITLNYIENLTGQKIPSETINNTLQKMVQFYITEKIQQNERYYSKQYHQ